MYRIQLLQFQKIISQNNCLIEMYKKCKFNIYFQIFMQLKKRTFQRESYKRIIYFVKLITSLQIESNESGKCFQIGSRVN